MTELQNDLVNAIQPTIQAAAIYPQIVFWGTLSVAAVALVQLAFVLWTVLRLRELARIRERLSRLADGLALLTDTTESGLSTISKQVEQLGRKPAPARPAARKSVAKRVVAAARRGDNVAQIAQVESLSENEIQLHLAMAREQLRKSAFDGAHAVPANGRGTPAHVAPAAPSQSRGSVLGIGQIAPDSASRSEHRVSRGRDAFGALIDQMAAKRQ